MYRVMLTVEGFGRLGRGGGVCSAFDSVDLSVGSPYRCQLKHQSAQSGLTVAASGIMGLGRGVYSKSQLTSVSVGGSC